MSFNPDFLENKAEDDDESFLTVANKCPKCNHKQESLLIMYQKDRYKRDGFTYSSMKIECFVCKWKVSGNYKWKKQLHST